MAAAKTTFGNMPHRNGAYFASTAAGNNVEITPDLHLKMSKKIAQLTKVVYALNTKNDEHENVLESLKEQHEEQLTQFLAETKGRVSELQRRVEENEKQREALESLRKSLLGEKENRKQLLEEFEQFKANAKEKEERLSTENEEKAKLNVRTLLDAKDKFEQQLNSFKKTRELLEKDKDKAINDLVKTHHSELDQLMKAHRVRYNEVVKDKESVKKELEERIKELSSVPDTSRVELEKLEGEYVAKLEKVKSLYEKELGLAKDGLRKAETSVKTANQRETDLRDAWKNQEQQYKERIALLRKDLDTSKESVSDLERSLSEMRNNVSVKHEASAEWKRKLEIAIANVNDLSKELRTARNDVEVTKKRCEGLTDELSMKSALHDKLEATCLNQEQSIKELKHQLALLKEKANKLEGELRLQENNKQLLATDSEDQLRTLQQNIADIERDRQDMKLKLLQELVSTKENAVKIQETLKTSHEEELSSLRKKHAESLQELDEKSTKLLADQKTNLESAADQERTKLVSEKDSVIKMKENECEELKKLYEQSRSEVGKLGGRIKDSEVGLGSASTKITRLNEMFRRKETEANALQSDLTTSKKLVENLQKELDDVRKSLEEGKLEAKMQLQRSLEDQRKELEVEWAERIKCECTDLRALLNKQHENGQHAALQQLSSLKEKEKQEIRHQSQQEIEQLRSKIAQLEKDVLETSSKITTTERSYRESANQERRRLEEKWAKEAFEHSAKLKVLEEKYAEEISSLKADKDKELKDVEERLKTAHDEDMLSQLKASQLSVEAVKSHAAMKRQQELVEERGRFEQDKRVLEEELLRRRKDEITKVKKEFEIQLSGLKSEVRKTEELRAKEAENHGSQVEELSNTIRENQLQINELSRASSENKVHVSQLQREIEAKGQEILTVRREANNHVRKTEERLGKMHQKEMDSLVAEHLRETQNMVHEFNRAQELLKDKVSALQIMLEEAEGRYRNRISRDEDVELIHSLKLALSDRELELKKLLDEKRYYQLELLNRETNFNKMFNKAAPNIGVVNPLQHKKKSSKHALQGQASGMAISSSRLEPMPVQNISVHDKKLNQNSPLPPAPPPKKLEAKRTTVY